LFWDQSVATYNAAMNGAATRRKLDHELAMAGAWHGERFRREGKRLKPLGHYLRQLRDDGKSLAKKTAEIASTFKAMAARGLDIKVRRIPKG
jgi:hypothetical protein